MLVITSMVNTSKFGPMDSPKELALRGSFVYQGKKKNQFGDKASKQA